LSKTNLFAEKYILYDTIYIKLKICQAKLYVNILYNKNWQMGMWIKSLSSVQWFPLGRSEEEWVKEDYINFPIMLYLWENIFEEFIAKCEAWTKGEGENMDDCCIILHANLCLIHFISKNLFEAWQKTQESFPWLGQYCTKPAWERFRVIFCSETWFPPSYSLEVLSTQ
jgi:hypothetical protein